MVERLTEQKGKGINKKIAAGILAGAVALGGFGWLESQNKGVKTPAPLPSATETAMGNTPAPSLESTPSQTPEATPSVTPSESPSPEPSPAHWYDITPTPVSVTDKVKVYGGYFVSDPDSRAPYYDNYFQDATILAEIPDKKDGILWVEAAVGGDKVEKVNCKTVAIGTDSGTVLFNQERCSYTGVTGWFEVKSYVPVYETTAYKPQLIGYGADLLASKLKIGETVLGIGAPVAEDFGYEKASDLKLNYQSFQKLEASVGETIPRNEKVFVFGSPVFVVVP